MVTRPPSAFSGFAGRRARFEHDRFDASHDRELRDGFQQLATRCGLTSCSQLAGFLTQEGFDLGMPRLAEIAALCGETENDLELSDTNFRKRTSQDLIQFLVQILDCGLAVRDFHGFRNRFANLYEYTRDAHRGEIASYIPELARNSAQSYGLSVCSIDGQRFAFGDHHTDFTIQSVVKPLNYALAMSLNGESLVHRHVGREPSGRRFNELALNADNRPHNPMINSGAIMCCSLIKPRLGVDNRLNFIRRYWGSATGGRLPGFDESVYASERATAKRNVALTNLMREHNAFPEDSDTDAALDLYFRACALTLDCDALSVIAAMLANGGVCPLTGHRVAAPSIVRNTLSLMLSCGMYDFSGEYAFSVGLPAKSGVSGGLMIVVPGVCGIGLWSPPLDRQGNSVRGIEFSRLLVDTFPFHVFAGVAGD
jgi:glutaminase